MNIDLTHANAQQLREYLLSSASCNCLGAKAETELQQSQDYVEAKQHVIDNQKKLAKWNGIRATIGYATGIMSGMFGGAILAAMKDGDFSDVINNPTVMGSGVGVAVLTGGNVYTDYRVGLIHTDSMFTNGESGARKGAEMGKLHAMHGHEVSLTQSEYTAQRVGEEVEKAMERSFSRHHAEQPDTQLAHVSTVSGHQAGQAHAR